MGTKTCSSCKEEKEISFFSKHRGNKDGLRYSCKQCDAVSRKKYWDSRAGKEVSNKWRGSDKGRESRRNTKLKARYGITLDDYYEMYESVDGSCEICKNEFDVLAVDHCHESGKVRGLLCKPCNTALGLMKDSQETLFNSQVYLLKDVDVLGGLNQ